MAKIKSSRGQKESLDSSFVDLANKASWEECNAYFRQVDSIVAPTELDTEIPILPRTLRDDYGDLSFGPAQEADPADPEVTQEQRAKARSLFKEIGMDLPES